ncbi:MAG TPA: hypothetical protein VEA16_18340 [Vicinamibacterales bacterium]|nr:hypothetical protein [Vicinamibacterales bacterium]
MVVVAAAWCAMAGLAETSVLDDPATLPRLAFEDLLYQGAFRLPAQESNGDSFSFGGRPVAFNPANSSLFVGTRSGRIAEINIPQPVHNADVAALPFATFLQPFADPAEGHIKDIAPEGAALSGLLVHGNRLYGTGVIYYDANNTQSLSHFSRPLTLSERASPRMVRVGQSGKTGFVAGYMAPVPPEWQSRLGGPAITGQCCIPIVSRTSYGPAAFAFDPAAVDAGKTAAAHPLLYYTSDHQTLGGWEGSNPTYGGTMQVGGLALIGGTRTALFIGRNGLGPFCYGEGTADKSKADQRGPGGERYCFDPASGDKGQHAYPYRYQMWAYDLNELAQVRAGRRDPWDVKPYGVWPFELPTPEPGVRVGGVAYDPAARRLFMAQMQADRDGYAFRALMHVFRVR